MQDKRRRIFHLAAMMSCLQAVPGWANTTNSAITTEGEAPAALTPITVTAEKTEQPLENVAASIAVIHGAEIEAAGLSSLEQLEGRVPGLSFQPFGQAGMNSPVMRGLTANFNTFSTSTLLLVDGVPTLTAQGFESSLLDVDRIEILRGPQSTLYGSNAEAGVIAIHTQPMDNQPRATVSGEVGNHGHRAARFAVSHPLIEDNLYASIAGSTSSEDGFIDNLHTGNHEDDRERHDLNLGLRWTPGDATDLALRYTRQEYDDGASRWGSPSAHRATVASGTPSWNRSWGQTLALTAEHEFASDVSLHSVTAWNDFRDHIQQDTDFRAEDILHVGRDNRLRTLSQELRLEGALGETEWLLGVYGDSSDHRLHSISKNMLGAVDLHANQESQTTALFTHWNLPLAQHWRLSTGGRIEHNQVELHPRGAASRSASWSHFSPKIALQYEISPRNQWYASISRGVRSGGFNILSPAANYQSFDPEKTWSYETGAKGWLAERRLRYSLAAYRMDIDSMQVMQMPSAGVIYIANAATATSQGVELDLDYLLGDGWQIKGGLAWNHTRFDQFQDGSADYAGNHNPFAPDFTGYLSLRYDDPEGWYTQGSLVGSSNVYLDAANQYERNDYALLNLVAGYQLGDWELAAYADNVADKQYDAVGYQNGFVTIYSPPREVGVRFTWRL